MLLRRPFSSLRWVHLVSWLGEELRFWIVKSVQNADVSSVGKSAVLGSYFLQERLGVLGKLGCAMCLLGSVVIVLHAPPDKPVETIDEILEYAIKPGM